MEQITRDNFPYEEMAQQLGYDIEGGINEEQRNLLYENSVNRHLNDKLEEFTGKGQKLRAIEDTVNIYGNDARKTLGVPDEITDKLEPFTPEKVLGFYDGIDEGFRDLKASEFLKDYSDQFYNDVQPLERKFLNNISKSVFKSRLKQNLGETVDFENDTVANLISKLTPPTPSEVEAKQLTQQAEDDEGKGIVGEDEGKGIVGESAEFIGNLGRGFYNSLVDTVSGTLRLASSAGDIIDNIGKDVIYDPETGEFLQVDSIRGTEKKIIDTDSFNNPAPGALWNAGDAIQDALKSTMTSDDLGDQVAAGIGQVGSLLAGGAALKFLAPVKLKGAAPIVGGSVIGIGGGGESGYQDYIQTIEEKDGDFNLVDAESTVALNGLIGVSELVPWLRPLNKLTGDGKVPVGALFEKIDKATGGIVSKNIKKVAETTVAKGVSNLANTGLGRVATDGLSGAAKEGAQEIIQGIASDFVAADIVQYDADRQVFVSDQTVEGGEVGAIVGFVLNSFLGKLSRGRSQKIKDNITGTPNNEDVSTEPLVNDDPVTNQTVTTKPQPEATIRRSTNQNGDPVVSASRDGVVGTGINDSGAMADLDERINRGPIDELTGEEIPTNESNTNGIIRDNVNDGSGKALKDKNGNTIQEATLKTTNGDVKFIGPNAESQLQDLIDLDLSDPNEPTTRLLRGSIITQDGETGEYTLSKDEFEKTGNDLNQLVSDLNETVGNKARSEKIASVRREEVKERSVIPIGLKGFTSRPTKFSPITTQESLESSGFTLLPNPMKSAKNAVVPSGFKAYKDGFIYTVKNTGKASSKQANVTIQDLDGFKYRIPNEESTQTFKVGDKIRQPTDAPLDINDLNLSDNPKAQGGIILRPPRKGIELIGKNIANSDGSPATVIISADSVNNVADRLGVQPTVATSDFAILEKNGNYIELFLTDDNDLAVTINGESILVDGDFDIVDGDKFKSMSIMTQELERNEYKVIDITDDVVTLQKGGVEGKIVTLQKYVEDVGVTQGDLDVEVKVDNLTGLRALLDIEQAVTTESFEPLRVKQQREADTTLETADKRTEVIVNDNEKARILFDIKDDRDEVQTVNGAMKIINSSGPDVVLDVDKNDLDTTLEAIRLSTVVPLMDIDLDDGLSGTGVSHLKRVEGLISNLPKHLRNLFQLHEKRPNPVSERGANGMFFPTSSSGKPAIHIDINPSRTYSDIVSTIEEELGHFSFDSWAIPGLTKLYDGLYKLIKTEVIAGLPRYIKSYKVNVENPSDYHKWVLVNEFFSKQATTLLDFDKIKIPRPPGITDADVKRIKQEVNDGIKDFTINLRDDFTGDPKEAKKMMMNILALQTGAALEGGVNLTYKTTGVDGAPEIIKVRNTPYGSYTHVMSDSESAQRIAHINTKIKRLRDNGHETLANLWTFHYKDINPVFGNTMLGRVVENKLDKALKPVANKQTVYLNKMTSRSDLIQVLLDSTALADLTISDSYTQAFVDSGVLDDTKSDGTLGRNMKLAKEADDFMREQLKLKNNNVGVIRQIFRNSKAIAIQMTAGNHIGARKNLPEWLRLLTQSMERFTVMWDHRAYTAFTKSGQGNLVKMMQELNGSGDIDIISDGVNAQKQINKIRRGGANKLSINKQKKIADLKNKVRLKKQFDGLNAWANLKVQDEKLDSSKENLNKIKIQRLTRLTKQNRPSLNQMTSASDDRLADADKARRLDPEIPKDRHYMNFLGLIEDPMMVSLANLEQQNDIIHKYKNRNEVAQILIEQGISKPIGSESNNMFYDDTATPVMVKKDGDNYTLLNFITSTDVFQEHVSDSMQIAEAIHSDIVDGILNQTVRTIKAGFTVFNRSVAMANYTGNIPLLVNGGVLLYLHRDMNLSVDGAHPVNLTKLSVTSIKEAWIDRMAYGVDEFNMTPEQMIIKEMEDGGVLNIGAAAFEAAVGSSAWLSGAWKGVTNLSNKANILSVPSKVRADVAFDRTIAWLRKFYVFGDEFIKIPIYLVNRQLGVAKARTEVNREDFDDGDIGESKYVHEIVLRAAAYASKRTNRETTNYPISSASLKRNSRNFLKILVGDFLMHPKQMLRIGAENVNLLVEDRASLSKAQKAGNTEYAELLKRRIYSRAAGIASSISMTSLAWTGRIGIIGTIWAASQNVSFENEEEDKDIELRNRKTLSTAESTAAYKISNIYTSQYSGQPLMPIGRDGNIVYYLDDKRLNALASPWVLPAPPTEEGHTIVSAASGFLDNFININNSSIFATMVDRLLNRVDQHKNKITVFEGMSDVGAMIIPSDFKEILKLGGEVYDVVVDTDVPGYSEEQGGPDTGFNLKRTLVKQAGVKISSLDMRSVMTIAARQTNAIYSKVINPYYRQVFEGLSSGDALDQSEIVDQVNNMFAEAESASAYFNNSITQFRNFGYDTDQIKRNYTKQSKNEKNPVMGKKNFDRLLTGVIGSHEIMVDRLSSKLKNLKTENPDHNTSRQDIINTIDNYQNAIDKYEFKIKQMRGQ